MQVVVRPARDDDVEAICAIGQATWPETYAFAGADYIEHGLAQWWSAEAVRSSLESTSTFVATVAGRVVAIGNVDLRPTPPVIWKLYVLPEYQGLGIGGLLLDRLVEAVPAEHRSIQIEYVAGNDRAAGVYERRGFVVVRRQPSEQPGWPAQVWAQKSLVGG